MFIFLSKNILKKIFVAFFFLNYITSLECARIKYKGRFFNTKKFGKEIPIGIITKMCELYSNHTDLFTERNGYIHFPHYSKIKERLIGKRINKLKLFEKKVLPFLKSIQS
jgi:hypothetical protein